MGYVIGQYNKKGDDKDTDKRFMTQKTVGDATRQTVTTDLDVFDKNEQKIFKNEGITLANSSPSTFTSGVTYYFHGQIKRLKNEQVFYIKLVDIGGNTQNDDENTQEQYIKTIRVAADTTSYHYSWVDVEFLFTPMLSFDTLLFELQRNQNDYLKEQRIPSIMYLEISEVNNALGNVISATNLVKMGVQGPPGFLMCINNEEIRIGKNGIYEIKNGLIEVNFFSPVGSLTSTNMKVWGYTNFKNKVRLNDAGTGYLKLTGTSTLTPYTFQNGEILIYEEEEEQNLFEAKIAKSLILNGYEYQDELNSDEWYSREEIISDTGQTSLATSVSFTKNTNNRKRTIDAFAMDYMYNYVVT